MGRWSVIGFGSNPEVGARLVHTAGLMMTLATFVQQNPVVVQLQQASTPVQVQMVTDTGFKWWLSSLAPWVGPLLSGVVSIYVAWKIFQWQGKKEREQWVRDQKKAEWSQLIYRVAEIERVLPLGQTVNMKRIRLIVEELKPAIHELLVVESNCIFLKGFFDVEENRTKLIDFIQKADKVADEIDGWKTVFNYPTSEEEEEKQK